MRVTKQQLLSSIAMLLPLGVVAAYFCIDRHYHEPKRQLAAVLSNTERCCKHPAETLRLVGNGLLLKIPNRLIENTGDWCYDADCKQRARRYSFIEKKATVNGYCQSEADEAFTMRSGFTLLLGSKNGKPFAVKAPGRSTRYLASQWVKIELLNDANKAVFCNAMAPHNAPDAPVFAKNRDFVGATQIPNAVNSSYYSGIRTKRALFFGNPVAIHCPAVKENDCSFEGTLHGAFTVSTTFKQSLVTPEYWTSFTQELEKTLRPWVVRTRTKPLCAVTP